MRTQPPGKLRNAPNEVKASYTYHTASRKSFLSTAWNAHAAPHTCAKILAWRPNFIAPWALGDQKLCVLHTCHAEICSGGMLGHTLTSWSCQAFHLGPWHAMVCQYFGFGSHAMGP
jgi:hypothetical protein